MHMKSWISYQLARDRQSNVEEYILNDLSGFVLGEHNDSVQLRVESSYISVNQ